RMRLTVLIRGRLELPDFVLCRRNNFARFALSPLNVNRMRYFVNGSLSTHIKINPSSLHILFRIKTWLPYQQFAFGKNRMGAKPLVSPTRYGFGCNPQPQSKCFPAQRDIFQRDRDFVSGSFFGVPARTTGFREVTLTLPSS